MSYQIFKDLDKPAATPADNKQPLDPNYDPHLGYSWRRVDTEKQRGHRSISFGGRRRTFVLPFAALGDRVTDRWSDK